MVSCLALLAPRDMLASALLCWGHEEHGHGAVMLGRGSPPPTAIGMGREGSSSSRSPRLHPNLALVSPLWELLSSHCCQLLSQIWHPLNVGILR